MQNLYMMRVLLILFFLSSFALSAQVYETANDIQHLNVGETIPSIEIRSLEGEKRLFTDIVKEKPTVVLFYRGGWCPYCNTHLAEIAAIEKEITKLGYQIVGISADAPEFLKNSVAKNELSYELYSDSTTELIQAMGIAIEAPDRYTNMLLEHSENKNASIIPVPAAFIVNTEGEILFVYSNPDFKKRISEEELLEKIKSL